MVYFRLKATLRAPDSDANPAPSSRAWSITRREFSQEPSQVKRGFIRSITAEQAAGLDLTLTSDLLRYSTPHPSGQQRASSPGHQHHPADPQRPPERHTALPEISCDADAPPLPSGLAYLTHTHTSTLTYLTSTLTYLRPATATCTPAQALR